MKQWILRGKRLLVCIGALLLCLALTAGAVVLGINAYMIVRTEGRICTVESLVASDADCILILGCGVNGENPSHMLEDRLKVGVTLYREGAAPKLLMSGDHGSADYNEVAVMKLFAMEEGIPSFDVFMDHAGFSTYDSLYRAREVFGAKKVIIVTQGYHLYRALYLAEQLGLEAYGVAADLRDYTMQWKYDARETLARVKDAISGAFLPSPQYLGQIIPIHGDGDLTNDEDFDRMAESRKP